MANYKNLRAHNAGSDLAKTWFIEYYFLNPETGKYKRFRETLDINRCKTLRERQMALTEGFIARQKLLESGWSPFETFDQNQILQKAGLLFISIEEAISSVLQHKKTHLKTTSFISINHTAGLFLEYLKQKKLSGISASSISRKHLIDYLDYRLSAGSISARTRNNELINLKSLFSSMFDMELIETNPTIRIKKLPQLTKGNETYSDQEIADIFTWLEENDPNTGLFCKMIYYSLIRPIELVRLQVKDIDLEHKYIRVQAEKSKTHTEEKVTIMEVLMHDLNRLNLQNFPGEYYLFTSNGRPGKTPTTRDFFTRKFAQVKQALGLSDQQTMYSLKHTSICTLIRNGANESEIRKYSRHKSSEGFNAYRKKYASELARDLTSFFFTGNFKESNRKF